uniref:Uncharacterized protein n=1 Tax=Gossypium raimondii TaxID=29730 RepID=A0A0D2PZ38_GOSRA|nr:hypothetical protein B456_005G243500 [Gossypium raimondii]
MLFSFNLLHTFILISRDRKDISAKLFFLLIIFHFSSLCPRLRGSSVTRVRASIIPNLTVLQSTSSSFSPLFCISHLFAGIIFYLWQKLSFLFFSFPPNTLRRHCILSHLTVCIRI